jgi:phage terminase large subunit-like protein
LREFLSEAEAFPQEGIHDDQIDALSGAFTRLRGTGALDYARDQLERQRGARTTV